MSHDRYADSLAISRAKSDEKNKQKKNESNRERKDEEGKRDGERCNLLTPKPHNLINGEHSQYISDNTDDLNRIILMEKFIYT